MPSLDDPEVDPPPDALPPGLEAAIRGELEPTEKVAWVGRPIARAMMRAELGACGFGLAFFSFSLFWIVASNAARKGGGPVPMLFGLPFVAVGLFQMTAPVRARLGARGTAYVLTDARAIVIRPEGAFGRSSGVHSFAPSTLGGMARIEHRDGSGDLVFREVPIPSGSRRGPAVERRGFLAVADVREVERLIRKTLAIG